MTGENNSQRQFRIDFQTSIITVFVSAVLLVGLTLVYLSFERVTSITRTTASGFTNFSRTARLLSIFRQVWPVTGKSVPSNSVRMHLASR